MIQIKKILIFLLITVSIGVIRADDTTTDETEAQFPGLLEMEFKQTIQFNTVGNNVGKGEYGEAALGTLTELKAAMTFPFTKWYFLTLWMREELYLFYDTDIKKGTSNPFDSVSSTSNSNFRMENRFYTGITNRFILPKDIMMIELTAAFRLRSELFKYVINDEMALDYNDAYMAYLMTGGTGTAPTMEQYGPATQLMVNGELNFAGDYDFGFSFMIQNKFFMYMHPNMYNESQVLSSIVSDLEYNGIYTAAYNFLYKLKNFGLSVYVKEDFDFGHKTPDYIISDADNTMFEDTRFENWTADVLSTFSTGLSFRAYDFTLFAGYIMKHREYIDYYTSTGMNMWAGLQAGFELPIKNWTISLLYVGFMPVRIDGETRTDQEWENTIQTAIGVKIDNMRKK